MGFRHLARSGKERAYHPMPEIESRSLKPEKEEKPVKTATQFTKINAAAIRLAYMG